MPALLGHQRVLKRSPLYYREIVVFPVSSIKRTFMVPSLLLSLEKSRTSRTKKTDAFGLHRFGTPSLDKDFLQFGIHSIRNAFQMN